MVSSNVTRLTAPQILARKGGEKLVALTCYTAPMAQILDPLVDILLVGDSLGMVVYGLESTLPVTLRMMEDHVAAVKRGSTKAFLLADLPFGSYQGSRAKAFEAASRLMQAGASGVKLEGGLEMAPTAKFLVARGIPVMAHIGLKPQHVAAMGGYKKQGKTDAARKTMLQEAQGMVKAGVFALLMEGTEESVARQITAEIPVPTIGIGASPACDGQVLVTEDMLGLFEKTPSFVTRYAEIRPTIQKAVEQYRDKTRKS